MKTKIIYISGNETFEMADIRAAFDEVRNALGLDNDTVLFGVPVDADDALANVAVTKNTVDTPAPVVTDNAEMDAPDIKIPETPVVPTVSEKPRKSRTRNVAPATDKIVDTPVPTTDGTTSQTDEKVIPILSILGAKNPTAAPAPTADDVIDAPAADEFIDTPAADEFIDAPIVDDVDTVITEQEIIDEPIVDVTIEEHPTIVTEIVETEIKIEEILDDEMPVSVTEKTLEHLFESIAPLGEDTPHSHITAPMDDSPEITDDFDVATTVEDDADATLEQLAAEFAENQDKIIAEPKPENHGKIGKLKNILPFKKARRDDNGLMGDLFGWAGVAANDEDFAIPGFFTNAAGKK